MKNKYRYIKLFVKAAFTLLFCIANHSCKKNDGKNEELNSFQIKSPVIASDSLLPVEYTCDGESACPPFEWSGAPSSTRYFAIIMYHIASPLDIHWYIVLYNIPVTVDHLEKNITNIGDWGTNSVNGRTAYAPPCSKGPGRKNYIITIYALSELITPEVPASEVNRETLLQSMEGKIISKDSMVVWYSRDVK